MYIMSVKGELQPMVYREVIERIIIPYQIQIIQQMNLLSDQKLLLKHDLHFRPQRICARKTTSTASMSPEDVLANYKNVTPWSIYHSKMSAKPILLSAYMELFNITWQDAKDWASQKLILVFWNHSYPALFCLAWLELKLCQCRKLFGTLSLSTVDSTKFAKGWRIKLLWNLRKLSKKLAR